LDLLFSSSLTIVRFGLSRVSLSCYRILCGHAGEFPNHGVQGNPTVAWHLFVFETSCGTLSLMRSRASRIVAAFALLICLVCPIVETFDTWDHTMQTGNDTEYALVILALCVGVAYSFVRLIFKSALLGSVAKSVFASCSLKCLLFRPCAVAMPFDATSPPALPLRI